MEEIVWKVTRLTGRTYARIPADRLNQFEKQGYRMQQHDEDLFMIEKISSQRAVFCKCIGSAEKIVLVALNVHAGELNHSSITTMSDLIDKAYILLGLLDIMFNCKNGDKVRRRTARRKLDV